MDENAQERPRIPAPQVPAGITDGVVELRKRRPSAPAPDRRADPEEGGAGPNPVPDAVGGT
ncbi:hypothetical protein WDV06_27325 [Streptomyces racemochromogenes]|uniref:Uncharacterized protein n=1 Tax=Streptomyces racemochromogenes TaxID=67353 RepID=A0ABW7PK34_9ACTN